MFKKFTVEENVSGKSQAKTSVVRAIRQKILESYPYIEPWFDDLFPKKTPVYVVKCPNHVSLVVINSEILFFSERNGPYIPTLRVLHKFPKMLPQLQVDKGAIRFVIKGANIMCPGLTSPGARMDVDLDADKIVAIMAEGKEHAVCIGKLKLSTKQIREQGADIGVINLHYLSDGLWKLEKYD